MSARLSVDWPAALDGLSDAELPAALCALADDLDNGWSEWLRKRAGAPLRPTRVDVGDGPAGGAGWRRSKWGRPVWLGPRMWRAIRADLHDEPHVRAEARHAVLRGRLLARLAGGRKLENTREGLSVDYDTEREAWADLLRALCEGR